MRIIIVLIGLILTAAAQGQLTPVDYDKKLHMGAGVYCGGMFTYGGRLMGWTDEEAALFGIAGGVAAGVGKELFDISQRWALKTSDEFDVNDIAATALGAVIGAGIGYVCLKIWPKRVEISGGTLNIKLDARRNNINRVSDYSNGH